jgi:AcrR family transcriptional regulator
VTSKSKTERSKQQLITVATRLFAEKGLRGVTARDIASEAGVSHSMIFRHFGGLDGLINASFQHLSAQVGQSSKFFEPLPDIEQLKLLADKLVANEALIQMFIHGLLDHDHRFEDPDHLAFKRLAAGLEKRRIDGGLSEDIDCQKLAFSSIAMAMGWLLIEPRIPDLLCEPALDRQAYRHELIDMWAGILAKSS